jgi:hypothetical protein
LFSEIFVAFPPSLLRCRLRKNSQSTAYLYIFMLILHKNEIIKMIIMVIMHKYSHKKTFCAVCGGEFKKCFPCPLVCPADRINSQAGKGAGTGYTICCIPCYLTYTTENQYQIPSRVQGTLYCVPCYHNNTMNMWRLIRRRYFFYCF